jgi:hypothetical protein
MQNNESLFIAIGYIREQKIRAKMQRVRAIRNIFLQHIDTK